MDSLNARFQRGSSHAAACTRADVAKEIFPGSKSSGSGDAGRKLPDDLTMMDKRQEGKLSTVAAGCSLTREADGIWALRGEQLL